MTKINKIKKIPLIIVKIEGGGKHILVKGKINSEKVFLLIDTGASNSIFDKDFHALNKDKLEHMNSETSSSSFNSSIEEFYTGEDIFLSLSRFRITLENVIFTSFTHVNALYESLNLPTISGILGSDFLIENNAVIDFPNKLLLLER